MDYDEQSTLQWPVGQPRARYRDNARFRNGPRGLVDYELARGRALDELELLGATDVVISRNRRSQESGDPGVAVYFTVGRDKQRRCLACDRWHRMPDNLAAIAAHVEAMRGQLRWGVGTVEQAFAGYAALRPVREHRPWWEVLGIPRGSLPEIVTAAWRELAKRHHPDRGGSPEEMAEINAAYQEAKSQGAAA